MRRVSSKEFIRQDMIEKYEEMDYDVDFDEADQSQQQLSLFWQNVQRGISVLERHQRNGEDVSHKYVISDDIDPDEVSRTFVCRLCFNTDTSCDDVVTKTLVV